MNKLNSSIKDVKDKGLIADYKEKAAEAMKKMMGTSLQNMVVSS